MISSACAMPSQVGTAAISAVHWVRARTKTRSKNSSSGVTRSSERSTAFIRGGRAAVLTRVMLAGGYLEGMARDTGLPQADAQFDFGRARRRRALSRVAGRLRREPSDVNVILPFEEVVDALGRRGERRLGLKTIDLDSIVGTVDRSREFDRAFRPTSSRVRPRWERIALAQRKGQSMPPIDVYRIGELHFVKDGHHRVSVARELGHEVIEAYVTEVITELGADRAIRMHDLALKSHQRLFYERVPLPPEAREQIKLSDEWRYASLAEAVEAWGFRDMQGEGEMRTREEIASAWFRDEYEPVIEMLREADLVKRGTETEAYMRVAELRYLLLRTHSWDDEVIEALRRDLEQPS